MPVKVTRSRGARASQVRRRVGLVYDRKEDYLAAGFAPAEVMEFDSEDTIAALEAALRELGHDVVRVGRGLELARRLAGGERWDIVFNFAEGVRGRSREAQVPAICELFDQPYTFADPLTCALTLDKGMAKRVVRDCGLATAPFAIVTTPADAVRVDLEPPLFVKPIAEGSSKGVTARSLVRERAHLGEACAELLAEFHQPVLVERYLPGREVTVGVLGSGATARVVAVMEVLFNASADASAYTALNKEEYLDRVTYRLVSDEPLASQSRELALRVHALLGCRDAARVDLRCDDAGQPCFLEVNPLPGLNAVRSDLPIMARLVGMRFVTLVGSIIDEAALRYRL